MPALGAPAQVKPPSFGGLALGAAAPAGRHGWVDSWQWAHAGSNPGRRRRLTGMLGTTVGLIPSRPATGPHGRRMTPCSAGVRWLVLQPHLLFAAVVVCAPGTGLMASTPPGPGQHEARPDRSGPHQRDQQPADLGHRQGHQAEPAVHAAVSPFVRSGLVAWARVTAKNAWASRARVMWRYQPGHLRTS